MTRTPDFWRRLSGPTAWIWVGLYTAARAAQQRLQAEQIARWRQGARQKRRALMATWKAAGRCVQCGGTLAEGSVSRCARHLALKRAAYAAKTRPKE